MHVGAGPSAPHTRRYHVSWYGEDVALPGPDTGLVAECAPRGPALLQGGEHRGGQVYGEDVGRMRVLYVRQQGAGASADVEHTGGGAEGRDRGGDGSESGLYLGRWWLQEIGDCGIKNALLGCCVIGW